MKKILLSGVAAVALFATAPAFAADIPVRAPQYKAPPVVAPVFNWTGFYFGGHVGYGWADSASGISPDGFIGGLQAGYNWQWSPNFVFGIEVDMTATDMNTAAGPSHIDYLGSARARLGYAWDTTMLYGTGGLAWNRTSVGGFHDTDIGWTLGAGIEWAFSRNWSAKVEYLYYNFDNATTFGDTDISTVKVGLNYRF